MLSQLQILRMLDAGQSARLVQRILLNGRCGNECAVAMLCHPGVAAPVAHGLALQRANELCYGTSDLVDELARRLVMFQNADGSFGNLRCAPDGLRLTATAVVVRGWLSWLDGHSAGVANDAGIGILEGVRRGLDALRLAFDEPGSVERFSAAWAIVLWQLGDREEWRQLVEVGELLHRLEAAPHSDMLNDLFAYAKAMAA
jgi:hypothetical protein